MEETQKSYEALVMLSCKTGGEGVDTIVDKLKSLVVERADLEFCKEFCHILSKKTIKNLKELNLKFKKKEVE